MPQSPQPARTLNALIDASCEKFGDRPALSVAFQDPLTYQELRGSILRVAAKLTAWGFTKGDRVAILAENSPRWCMAYLGAVRIGVVVVPILPDFPESDILHILPDAGVRLLFTTEKQIEKIGELAGHKLEKVVTLDDFRSPREICETVPFRDFLAADSGLARKEPLGSAPGSDDLASIIYTSGTSGHSKAVLLSHGNLCANVDSASGLVNITPDWTFVSVLPISHTYEFTVGFLLPMRQGARVVYCDQRPTPTVLNKVCAVEKPTVMCVVPMIMEKIYKKRVLPALSKGRFLPLLLKFPLLRGRILAQIAGKLRKFFGGELQLMAIGGAALNIEVEKFLHESGFPYIVGYGLTECAPLVAGGPAGDPTIAVGSCGKPVPRVSVRIEHPDPVTGVGEILVRGPNVMQGYFHNPEATAATINAEGWVATGDLGHFDQRNNLFITGRSKSVIVLSHGENIYPEAIEEKLNSSIYVAESLVTESGDRLVATIFPDYEYLDLETAGQSETEKFHHITAILREIQRTVNTQLPQYAQISRIVERQEPFIKTATHKIKRYLYSGCA
ncbi:MAG: long-chain fatty acid--CoA ligase [Desulfobulbaceae bacterium]|nr:long-chain fatty acid--CoA ligase [Desulfobulbaceae bacterium]